MRIITLSGKARNGKDTFASYIKEILEQKECTVQIVHYADLLKYICKQYYNWNGEKDEKGRALLQTVGTDIVRAKDENFWVKELASIVRMFFDDYDYVIIADCRFPNEIDYWIGSGYDVSTVYLMRNNFASDLTAEQMAHPSETALDSYSFEYYITTASLKELYEAATWFVDNITKEFE